MDHIENPSRARARARVTVQLPRHMLDDLKRIAHRTGESESWTIRQALREHIAEHTAANSNVAPATGQARQ